MVSTIQANTDPNKWISKTVLRLQINAQLSANFSHHQLTDWTIGRSLLHQ